MGRHVTMENESSQDVRQSAEILRNNVDKFANAILTPNGCPHTLAELLNPSFSIEMIDILIKRMTCKLRNRLFTSENVKELIQIALDNTKLLHTRTLATTFVINGNALTSWTSCNNMEYHQCYDVWNLIFDVLCQETGDLIQFRITNDLLNIYAQEDQKISMHSNDNLSEQRDLQNTPKDQNNVLMNSSIHSNLSPETANIVSQLLRYVISKGQKACCVLRYLETHPTAVNVLIANIGNDDIRVCLLHLVYADHSEEGISSLFETKLLNKLATYLMTAKQPETCYERDLMENCFLLLRDILHAPYLTARGDAISAKTMPIDKITGHNAYLSICGASRDQANSSLRKYSSRKVRYVVQLFMDPSCKLMYTFFSQMMSELYFWNPIKELKQYPALLQLGKPRPACTRLITHLFQLTETVDLKEEEDLEPPSRVIECVDFNCSTHLQRSGTVLMRHTLQNEIRHCELNVNCMLGLRITPLAKKDIGLDRTKRGSLKGSKRKKRNSSNRSRTSSMNESTTQSPQKQILLDEIEAVQTSTWHPNGFEILIKKKRVETKNPGQKAKSDMSMKRTLSPTKNSASHLLFDTASSNIVPTNPDEILTVEYFAASSKKEQSEWIEVLRAVVNGDLNALETFCSSDWRSNVLEYQQLRECLIVCMEQKCNEFAKFLHDVVISETRQISGYHLWQIVKFLRAIIANESKRLDRLIVSTGILDILILCLTKYPTQSLMLSEICNTLILCFEDFKSKRSRKCPIIGQLLGSADESSRFLKLALQAYQPSKSNVNQTISCSKSNESCVQNISSILAQEPPRSQLRPILDAISKCYHEPKTKSHERIQRVISDNHQWKNLIEMVSASSKMNASQLCNLPSPQTPLQPVFQDAILESISRPCYTSKHGYGSSFLLGEGCAFGYLFKERLTGQDAKSWQKVLVVYEFVSYKLWYFFPNEINESQEVTWKWIVPLTVKRRYTHGHDESHASIGHHGLYVIAYDHEHQRSSSLLSSSTGSHADWLSIANSATREFHFSATTLEDRNLWMKLLSTANTKLRAITKDYSVMCEQLKVWNKKNETVSHCEEVSCHAPFSLFRRPHSCKRCGRWMCGKCMPTKQRLPIPELGILKPVRHCNECFNTAASVEAQIEPANLQQLDSKRYVNSNGKQKKSPLKINCQGLSGIDEVILPQDVSRTSNSTLYELAHGMVSPHSLLVLNRRMNRKNSVESPTNTVKFDSINFEEKLEAACTGAQVTS